MKLDNCDIGDGVHIVLLDAWWRRGETIRDIRLSDIDIEWTDSLNDARWETVDRRMTELMDSGVRVFVFTMNPRAIDKMAFTSAEDVRLHILFADEHGLHNMSADDADRFYRAYQVGVQHVSEILTTEGLW